MQLAIARYRKYALLSAVAASSLALLGATGGFPALVRVGDAALESYNELIRDEAHSTMDRLNPTYPRCF